MDAYALAGGNYPPERVEWTEEKIQAVVEYYAAQARRDLWAYRQFMDPHFTPGWFPHSISVRLQKFFYRLMRGERPKLIIEAPPQHGKSRSLHDFMSWVAGKAPHLKIIYASFSRDLGVDANTALQRAFDDPKYHIVFPETTINRSNVVTISSQAKRNSSLLEFVGHRGSFRNTTVNGQINGKALDLGVIDDPLKGRAAASSKIQRDKTWTWFIDDFLTRFSDGAGFILLATRWHVDDPTGRLLKKFPDAEVIKFPAMWDGVIRPYDPRRVLDEPLFPEFKSSEFLLERKNAATTASWMSLYQQSPIVTGGGLFPLDRVHVSAARPPKEAVKKSVRYWDKAGTAGGGAYSAGVLMHQLKDDGGWFIEDVRRGQWSAWERERNIKAAAERDAAHMGEMNFETWVEQEPGSGGKESAERTIAMLAGLKAYKDRVTGNKETRAEPYAAQWQGGNITILANDEWNDAFLDEHEAFPSGQYKDQVDSAAGAFAQCSSKKYSYDTSLDWVD